MKILNGLWDHQVLQRNKRNLSETFITGKSSAAGTLFLKATDAKTNKALPNLANKKISTIKRGNFKTKITGLPTGGPYNITLKLVDKSNTTISEFSVQDVLVGDVWILGGQSNMQGVGHLKDAANPNKNVRAFYMNDHWDIAKDTIHNLPESFAPVHRDLNCEEVMSTYRGVGPGIAFGQELAKLTSVPQGLIACAHGGTTMEQWDPKLKKLGDKSLYGATYNRFIKNGGNIKGVAWYQGCSDASPEAAQLYTERMKKFVAAFRRDFGNANLPFATVQIAGVHTLLPSEGAQADWNNIQEQQRNLPKVIKNLAVVPAIDLSYDDSIHIGGKDQQRLGKRLAQAMWTMLKGEGKLKSPIEFKSVKMIKDPDSLFLNFKVTFDNVEGELKSAGKANGFTLTVGDNFKLNAIFDTQLNGNSVLLRTYLPAEYCEDNICLHYGHGCTPYCNILDTADRSLPVMGPIPATTQKPTVVNIKNLRTSKLLPGQGKLEKTLCPDTSDKKLKWKTRNFPTAFANLQPELSKKTKDAVVFFASKFNCDTAMQLQLGLGYDGPTKIWLDKKEIFHDPNGTNPMLTDEVKLDLKEVKAGNHEIVTAFSANFGKAWGIAIRLHRLGLTKKQIDAKKPKWKNPEILG